MKFFRIRLVSLQAEEKNMIEEATQHPDAKSDTEDDDKKMAPAEPPKKKSEHHTLYASVITVLHMLKWLRGKFLEPSPPLYRVFSKQAAQENESQSEDESSNEEEQEGDDNDDDEDDDEDSEDDDNGDVDDNSDEDSDMEKNKSGKMYNFFHR